MSFDLSPEMDALLELMREWQSSGLPMHGYAVRRDAPLPAEADAARSVIVLQADTRLELGGPAAGSLACTICSPTWRSPPEADILVVGPEIDRNAGRLPLAQLLLLEADEEIETLLRYIPPPGLLCGCMCRRTRNAVWYRISRDAASLSLADIGSAQLRHLYRTHPAVRRAALLFITDDATLKQTTPIAAAVSDACRALRRESWRARGVDVDACVPGAHCGACSEKVVCRRVRAMEASYRKEARKP